MDKEIISIVIPSYNRLHNLRKTLPSYCCQELVKEIIIVDDGSTDGTEAYINSVKKKYPIIKYIRHDFRKNLPATRNTGIAYSSGDYILFGEDDVIFDKDYSTQLMQCMQEDGADIIAGRLIETYIGEDSKIAVDRADSDNRPFLNKRYLFLRVWKNLPADIISPLGVHSCSLIKKAVFEQVKYDEAYIGNANREETDFYVTAVRNGFKVFFCPHVKCFHLKPIKGKANGGGCWDASYVKYGYWFMRNNALFLKRHLPFLKETLNIRAGYWVIQARSFFHILIRFVLQNYFRQRYPHFYQYLLNFIYKFKK